MSLLTLRDVSVAFGGPPVLQDVRLNVEAGDRACVTGRNGEGKSTLLKVMAGALEPDAGEVVRAEGLRAAYLSQDVPADEPGTAAEVAGGTAAARRHLATLSAERAQFVPAGGTARDLAPETLPALVAALAAAEPSDLPEGGSIEGTDGTLLLFLEDGFLAMLRAAIPDEAPDDALVGFREIEVPAEGGAPRLSVSAPARVPGLGRILLPSPAP